MDLPPVVQVLVHPVDTKVHPTYPEGFRWAVMVGSVPPTDLDHCANAGMATTEQEASMMGETVGAAATKALRTLGVPARYAFQRLGYDPMPAEADQRPVGQWAG